MRKPTVSGQPQGARVGDKPGAEVAGEEVPDERTLARVTAAWQTWCWAAGLDAARRGVHLCAQASPGTS